MSENWPGGGRFTDLEGWEVFMIILFIILAIVLRKG